MIGKEYLPDEIKAMLDKMVEEVDKLNAKLKAKGLDKIPPEATDELLRHLESVKAISPLLAVHVLISQASWSTPLCALVSDLVLHLSDQVFFALLVPTGYELN